MARIDSCERTREELLRDGGGFCKACGNAIILSELAAKILQGFPEDWVFSGATKKARWSQLGQAMPPPLAHAVAAAVVEQMRAARATAGAATPIPTSAAAHPSAESGRSGPTGDTARTAWGPGLPNDISAADAGRRSAAATYDPETVGAVRASGVTSGAAAETYWETAGQGAPTRELGGAGDRETTPAGPAVSNTLDLAAAAPPAQENGPTREGRDVEAGPPSGVPRSTAAAEPFEDVEQLEVTPCPSPTAPGAAGPAHKGTPAAPKRLSILLVGADGSERRVEAEQC